jgi:Tol biopolymer transport system component
MSRLRRAAIGVFIATVAACARTDSTSELSPSPSPLPTQIVHDGRAPIFLGEPIDLAALSGRIVTDDFEDVFAMDVDGSHVVTVAGDPTGPEFDGAWSPDGEWIVYRDSTRGINENDEIFVVRSDGTDRRNLTRHPANDWGPDWSPDGSTIVFNSDRGGGGVLSGYLVDPDGSNLRRIDVDTWLEYPSFSPDGTRIAFEGALGSNYELFVADLATGATEQLTDSPGHDGWPSWSPDGSAIAFTSVRDDCSIAPPDQECWVTDEEDEHHDIWLIDPDGANLRQVTPEFGHFVGWSPDSRYLVISGYALYVVRPDGTGRVELRADGIPLPLGGIPDWR